MVKIKSKDLIDVFTNWCEMIPVEYPGSKYEKFTPKDFTIEFKDSDSLPYLELYDYHLLPHYVTIATKVRKDRRKEIRKRVEAVA